jgi:myosin-3
MRQSIKFAQAAEAKKGKPLTVAQRFKDSLEALMVELNLSNPHFIRCVKPNLRKIANTFDDELVTKQLRYTGMLETTRIRREGYASRPLFDDFVKRYKIIGFECRAQVPSTGDACRQILTKSGISGFEIGKTKVFLRYFHVDELNAKLQPYNAAASLIGKYARCAAAKEKYRRMLAAKREQEKKVDAILNSVGLCA